MKIIELKRGDIFNMFYGFNLEKTLCLYNNIDTKEIGFKTNSIAGVVSYNDYNVQNFEFLNPEIEEKINNNSTFITFIIIAILSLVLGIIIGILI